MQSARKSASRREPWSFARDRTRCGLPPSLPRPSCLLKASSNFPGVDRLCSRASRVARGQSLSICCVAQDNLFFGVAHECRPHSANISRCVLPFLPKTDPLVSIIHPTRNNNQASGIGFGSRVVFACLRDEMPSLPRGSHICARPHCGFFTKFRRTTFVGETFGQDCGQRKQVRVNEESEERPGTNRAGRRLIFRLEASSHTYQRRLTDFNVSPA